MKYCERERASFPDDEFEFDEDLGGEIHKKRPRHYSESGEIVGGTTGGGVGPLNRPHDIDEGDPK